MKVILLLLSLLSFAYASAAAPLIEQGDVAIFQSEADRLVTVEYVLRNSPGVVTVDFQTNTTRSVDGRWVSIGQELFRDVGGAVNRLVLDTDVVHRIVWQPTNNWANVRLRNCSFRAVVKAWATNAPPDYMVIDLLTTNVNYYVSQAAMPLSPTNKLHKTSSLVMRRVHAANVEWRMGSPKDRAWRGNNYQYQGCEEPRLVTLSRDYYLAIFETTQEQYRLLRGASSYSGEETSAPNVMTLPAQYMSHGYLVETFLPLASRMTGIAFGLPTEAQWEFACRAGADAPVNTGRDLTSPLSCTNMNEVAWYVRHKPTYPDSWAAYDVKTAEVGLLEPNAWGFYDMQGNVAEHCMDYGRQDDVLEFGLFRDPQGPETGDSFVTRGGSIAASAALCTPYARYDHIAKTSANRYVGVRLCAPPVAAR